MPFGFFRTKFIDQSSLFSSHFGIPRKKSNGAIDMKIVVPCVLMTEEQKSFAKETLICGVKLLKKWHSHCESNGYKGNYKVFRVTLMNKEQEIREIISACRRVEFASDVKTINKIKQKHEILDNRTVEEAYLQQFSGLAKKFVFKVTHENNEDHLQDMYLKIIETIYYYDRPEIEMSTFLGNVIKNKMIDLLSEASGISPLTANDRKLLVRYEKEKYSGSNFQEIVDSLGLSSEDVTNLRLILTKVYSEGNIVGENLNSDKVNNDYTGYRHGVSLEKTESEVLSEEEHVAKIIRNAGLNKMEKEVFEAAMNPFVGWQTVFAESHLNPRTGQPYTKTRITQLLQSARDKVRETMEKEVAA
ncbi:MAG: hypothetical protein EKK64_04350 [Neisseriaceae bacterium]|nr:MAG: hypothetical protein EKK64_04350 [Neisseriaceae bacterium]